MTEILRKIAANIEARAVQHRRETDLLFSELRKFLASQFGARSVGQSIRQARVRVLR